jgi:hypothetical protein
MINLGLVGRRPVRPNDLPYLPRPEPPDDGRAHDERQEDGGGRRAGGPKRDVLKDPEGPEVFSEWKQEVIEH